MPLVRGPDTQKLDGSGIIKVWVQMLEEFQGETLGDVLSAYSDKYGSTFSVYDGSDPDFPIAHDEVAKYFWFNGVTLPGTDFVRRPVDIHVIRDRRHICPKQDLSFRLLPTDVIEIEVRYGC